MISLFVKTGNVFTCPILFIEHKNIQKDNYIIQKQDSTEKRMTAEKEMEMKSIKL